MKNVFIFQVIWIQLRSRKNISEYYQLKTMLIEAQEEKEDDAKPILVRNELRLAACEPLE